MDDVASGLIARLSRVLELTLQVLAGADDAVLLAPAVFGTACLLRRPPGRVVSHGLLIRRRPVHRH